MLNDKEWISLALHLLKNWRQAKSEKTRDDADNARTLGKNITVADHVLELAKRCGVKDEFLEMLPEIPLMTIEVKELDEWSKRLKHASLRVNMVPVTKRQKRAIRTKKTLWVHHEKPTNQLSKLNGSSKDSPPQSNGKPKTESPDSSPDA